MSLVNLQPHELMQIVADFLESQKIAYRVVGSMASMAYGEPRFTNDVDIVAELSLTDIPTLCAAFPSPEYYLSEPAVRAAILRRSQFNIIHPASGLKADVIIPPDSDFARSEAGRIRRLTSEGEYSAWFGSPEDVLLSKLVYYQLSGHVSDKHLRDITSMLKLQGPKLDLAYIESWADRLGVKAEWSKACERRGAG